MAPLKMNTVELTKILIDDESLVRNWRRFFDTLNFKHPGLHSLENRCINGTAEVYELFHAILSRWVSKKGKTEANLDTLIKLLKDEGFVGTAELVEENLALCTAEDSPVKIKKIKGPIKFLGRLKKVVSGKPEVSAEEQEEEGEEEPSENPEGLEEAASLAEEDLKDKLEVLFVNQELETHAQNFEHFVGIWNNVDMSSDMVLQIAPAINSFYKTAIEEILLEEDDEEEEGADEDETANEEDDDEENPEEEEETEEEDEGRMDKLLLFAKINYTLFKFMLSEGDIETLRMRNHYACLLAATDEKRDKAILIWRKQLDSLLPENKWEVELEVLLLRNLANAYRAGNVKRKAQKYENMASDVASTMDNPPVRHPNLPYQGY